MSVLPDRGAGSARRHRPRLRHRGGIPRYAPSRSHPCPADPPRARRVGGRPGSAPRGDAGGAVRGCGTRGEGGAHRPQRLAPGVQRRAGRRPECLSPAFSPPGGTRPGVAPRLSHVPAPGGGGYTRPPGPRRGLVFETEPRRTQLAEAKTNPTRTEVKILVPDQQPMVALVGQADALLKLVERAFDARIVVRGNEISISGPAVEAGERLGFLPGTLYEKIDPYLKPLYDALFDMMDAEAFNRLMERGTIEVAPLAYMRGRTLNDSFIILDEAQNTTPEQMKMFLTRMGFNAKMVVTGDITQIDLPNARRSGLLEAMEVLKPVEGIFFNMFTEEDVVRHHLVQRIVRAYDERSRNQQMSLELPREVQEQQEPQEPPLQQ